MPFGYQPNYGLAGAKADEASAQANLARLEGGRVAAETQNLMGQNGASSFLPLAQSQSAQALGQAALFSAEADRTRQDTTLNNPYDRSYSTGTARVPGNGDGTKDTVNSKLAPGEAVLNKAAADHLGRNVIELLNAIGEHKMKFSDAAPSSQNPMHTDQGATQGYKRGTANVPADKPMNKPKDAPKDSKGMKSRSDGAKAPAKAAAPKPKTADAGSQAPSPKLLQAILGMGGMPSPQGLSPMPASMPMPMASQDQWGPARSPV